MKHVRASLLWITLAANAVYFPAGTQDAQANRATLKAESARILAEGDRIKGEADLMRSEATRLDSEADELQKGAAYLDQLWENANKLDPNKYKDYAGRDKSQQRMRLNAEREKRDAVSLRIEGRKLDAEAVRLWKLAAAVDPQALKDLLDRLRNCCKLEMSRALKRSRKEACEPTKELRPAATGRLWAENTIKSSMRREKWSPPGRGHAEM